MRQRWLRINNSYCYGNGSREVSKKGRVPTRIHRVNGVILAIQIPVQRQRAIDVTQPSVRACPATDNGATLKSVLLQTSSPTIEIAGYSVEETCPRRLL